MHNAFLHVLVQSGFLGGVAIIIGLAIVWVLYIQYFFMHQPSDKSLIPAGNSRDFSICDHFFRYGIDFCLFFSRLAAERSDCCLCHGAASALAKISCEGGMGKASEEPVSKSSSSGCRVP